MEPRTALRDGTAMRLQLMRCASLYAKSNLIYMTAPSIEEVVLPTIHYLQAPFPPTIRLPRELLPVPIVFVLKRTASLPITLESRGRPSPMPTVVLR